MKETLILARLNDTQIETAKSKNGKRKQITHAVLCGRYGQMFGTETHCNKYYSAWRKIFPSLFEKAIKVNNIQITNHQSTYNLSTILLEESHKLTPKPDHSFLDEPSTKLNERIVITQSYKKYTPNHPFNRFIEFWTSILKAMKRALGL